MRTTFTFDDDKQLVQIARGYAERATRISWNEVAHRMRSTGHTAAALRQRLQSLYRTWGRDIARFPANFYTPVQRPRGRPPGITQQLRRSASNATALIAKEAPTPPPVARRAPTAPAVAPPRATSSQTPTTPPRAPEAAVTRAARAASRAAATPPRDPEVAVTRAARAASRVAIPPPPAARQALTAPSPEPETSVLSSSDSEEAASSIFARVSRAEVAYAGSSPHLNVGEVLPAGVTTLLRELGDISARDVFFDIGSGLGNVVVQVVLATKVSMAIGIEIRDEVQDLGVDMIARSPYARRLDNRSEFIGKDITGIHFSRVDPYAQATIVFWNNILFEVATIEFVKRELSEMTHVRLFVCTAPICPRHREPCFSEFCSSFELFKEADIACSWKAELQRAYFYRSFQSLSGA